MNQTVIQLGAGGGLGAQHSAHRPIRDKPVGRPPYAVCESSFPVGVKLALSSVCHVLCVSRRLYAKGPICAAVHPVPLLSQERLHSPSAEDIKGFNTVVCHGQSEVVPYV